MGTDGESWLVAANKRWEEVNGKLSQDNIQLAEQVRVLRKRLDMWCSMALGFLNALICLGVIQAGAPGWVSVPTISCGAGIATVVRVKLERRDWRMR